MSISAKTAGPQSARAGRARRAGPLAREAPAGERLGAVVVAELALAAFAAAFTHAGVVSCRRNGNLRRRAGPLSACLFQVDTGATPSP